MVGIDLDDVYALVLDKIFIPPYNNFRERLSAVLYALRHNLAESPFLFLPNLLETQTQATSLLS